MPILKYKLNGQWIELSGGAQSGGGSIAVDPSLSIEGMAADAKATGDVISALGEVVGNAVTNDVLGEVVGALSESIGNVESQISKKQNKVYFNNTKPADWQNGDVWLKPAE